MNKIGTPYTLQEKRKISTGLVTDFFLSLLAMD